MTAALREFLAPVKWSITGENFDKRTTRLLMLATSGTEFRRNERPCNHCGHSDYEYRWTSSSQWPPTPDQVGLWWCVCGSSVDGEAP